MARIGDFLDFGRELNAMDQVIGIRLTMVHLGRPADKVMLSPQEQFLHKCWRIAGA